MAILKKITNLFSRKVLLKYFFWSIPLFVILGIFLLIKGCSSSHGNHKPIYYIGRENVWQIELLGRERSFIAFTTELLATIGAEHHIRFEWIETNPTHILNGLDEGNYDFILSSMRPNSSNQQHYVFSELLFNLGPVLIVREDSQVTSLNQMKGQPVGVPYGFGVADVIKIPGVNLYDMALVYYNSINEALEGLINDHVDGVIMKAVPAYTFSKGLYAGKVKVVTAPLYDEGLRLIALKHSELEEVIKLINGSIEKMRKDGTYRALIAKWTLIDPQSQFWRPDGEQRP